MDFNQAKDIIMMAALTGICGYLAYQVRILVESINELNVKMASIVGHLENHKETLNRHEEHLQRLDGRFDNT